MRIVCIASSQVPSDTANSIQVMKVCQAFTQLGHELLLLVPGSPPNDLDEAALWHHYGIRHPFAIEWLEGRSRRLFPWKAARQALQMDADLVYCWTLQAAVLAMLAGKPVLVELHDLPGGRFGPRWLKWLLRLPGRKRLLPISAALSHALRLPEEVTLIAPDGVDLERYSDLPDPSIARRQARLPDACTVLCTGHLYAGRGAALFLSLAARFPASSFVWVGGRPVDVQTWIDLAAERGLTNITFTGFVPNEDIPLYQAAADILLMPYGAAISTSSGGNTARFCSPMKMFEYMASGRAIVTSDLPVLREVLDESMTVFCPPEDAGAWGTALSRLIADPALRGQLGQRARQAVERYAWIERARRSLEAFHEGA
jgi:glycosyltransferase involved in cell wall biosynthesis